MTKQDRMIAAIVLIHSLTGIAWAVWVAYRVGSPTYQIVVSVAMAMTGLVAGVGSLRRHRWARVLGVLYFAAQVLHVATPDRHFSLLLGFNLSVSIGWAGTVAMGLNLFALAMLLWAWRRLLAPDSALRPASERGARGHS